MFFKTTTITTTNHLHKKFYESSLIWIQIFNILDWLWYIIFVLHTNLAFSSALKKHGIVKEWSTTCTINPHSAMNVLIIMKNQVTINVYWYNEWGLTSQMNRCLLVTTCFISFDDSRTSQNPNVGSNSLPGVG